MPINSFLYPGPTNSNPYVVDNSCRFNDDDSACLNRSNGSSPSSQRIFTFSAWVKRGNLGSNNQTFMSIQDTGDGDPRVRCAFRDDDKLYFEVSASDGSGAFDVRTTAVFRDVSAWYHFVFRIDTTQSTAADRVKMYVNGSQITSFSTATYGSQNYDLPTNLNEINIGTVDNNSRTNFFDGYLAEVVYCDGQSLAPSSFGEFDEDSPTIWKPKDVSGLTFGTNGFYLDFEDSANLGNDKNGGTDFTANNLAATDQSTDTCTNNFATLNPLVVQTGTANEPVFREGNLQIHGSSTGSIKFYSPSSIGVSSGKWYAEFLSTISSNVFGMVGVDSNPSELARNDQYPGYYANSYGYYKDGNKYTGNSASSYGNSWTNNTIGVALDLDNNKLYFSKDGTWQNSGDPESGSTGTGAISITEPSSTISGFYFFVLGDTSASYINPFDCNFGNPIHTISSGNSDANGYGNFEYAVPSGYYALNTKNLAEYG